MIFPMFVFCEDEFRFEVPLVHRLANPLAFERLAPASLRFFPILNGMPPSRALLARRIDALGASSYLRDGTRDPSGSTSFRRKRSSLAVPASLAAGKSSFPIVSLPDSESTDPFGIASFPVERDIIARVFQTSRRNRFSRLFRNRLPL